MHYMGDQEVADDIAPSPDGEPVWTLGDHMWKARKLAGLEQADVAAAVGVSRATISKWERDVGTPNVRQLERFAAATGVPTVWLYESLKTPAEVQAERIGWLTLDLQFPTRAA